MVKVKRLNLPKVSKDSFEKLQAKGILTKELADVMIGMVSFRNIAIYEYKKLDFNILKNILAHPLQDFQAFAQIALSYVA